MKIIKNQNILHVVNIYFVLPYFIGDQFIYFKEKGFNLNVICSSSSNLNVYAKRMGFNYLEVEIVRSINLLKDLIAILAICKYIKKNKIDIVIGHTPKGALLAMIAAKIMCVPKRIYFRHGLVFETMLGNKKRLMINLDRITAFCATKVVCVSPSLFDKSIEYKLNSSKKQIVLGKGTCGGIDAADKFNPEKIDPEKLDQLRAQLKIESNCFTIGYCGRLVKDKGIIELVEAFEHLKLMHDKKLKLLLVGDFEERDALPTTVIDKIRIDKDIIVTGFIFNDIEYYYALMNLYILPSYREGFPTSVLEASAMKIPILTTKATGCIDSIIEGETGEYITNSSENISASILNLMNSEKLKIIGENGRNFVLNNFDNQILWPIIEDKLYNN